MACSILGIKPQTLYAYVSRHGIAVRANPRDSRESLYSRADIEHLFWQSKRPRARSDVAQAAIHWGDPVLATSISEVRDGTIWLRGKSIEACANEFTLEEIAARLSGTDEIKCPPTNGSIKGTNTFSRAMKALANEVEMSPSLKELDKHQIRLESARMLSIVADACLGQRLSGQIHQRVGHAWDLPPDEQDKIRQALVLLSDHELNPSTFAVRVCASTGTSLPSALLAGMATLSGTLHGGVGVMAMRALNAQIEGSFEAFLCRNDTLDPIAYGFGHPLYPNGDPRAVHLLGLIPDTVPEHRALMQMAERVERRPNIDAALAAMSSHLGCPGHAPGVIFSIGRVAGWIAHAIEQVQSKTIIRPRAKLHST